MLKKRAEIVLVQSHFFDAGNNCGTLRMRLALRWKGLANTNLTDSADTLIRCVKPGSGNDVRSKLENMNCRRPALIGRCDAGDASQSSGLSPTTAAPPVRNLKTKSTLRHRARCNAICDKCAEARPDDDDAPSNRQTAPAHHR